MDEALIVAIHDPEGADLEPCVRLAMRFVERRVVFWEGGSVRVNLEQAT